MSNIALYDRLVQHLADTRLYEDETSINVSRAVRRHQKRLKSVLAKDLKSDLKPEITRATVELRTLVSNSINDYADAAVSFQANSLAKSVGDYYKVVRPKGSDAVPNLIGPNLLATKSLKGHFDAIGTLELTRAQARISDGLVKGLSTKKIIENVLDTTGLVESQVKTLVRTAITSTQSSATDLVIQANKHVIKGYRFTAVLDSRTSNQCARQDGEIYNIDDVRFRPPLHWNCRSSLVPVLKSKEELLKEDNERFKRKKLEEAKDNGPMAARETYSQWLKRQPMVIQVQHLGDEVKAGLLQAGTLTLNAFTNLKGKQLGIAALRKLDNARTFVFPTRQRIEDLKEAESLENPITRPYDLLRSADNTKQLKELYIADAENARQALSLTDFRGTSLAGKRSVRVRSNNEFDERNNSYDPFTGEVTSTLLYNPDFNVLQERLDFVKNSKVLNQDQKAYITDFVNSLDDVVSVNQQTAIAENLRVVFERQINDKQPWNNFANVVRAEMQFSVVNTSRILDRRSRANSSQFDSYGEVGEPAKVQVFGKYYTFEEIQRDQLADERFVKAWEARVGRKLARDLLYRGKTPLFTWFQGPIGRDNVAFTKQVIKFIEKTVPGAKQLFNAKAPTLPSISDFLRGKREDLRSIIDLEFLFNKNRKNYLDELAEDKIGGEYAIDVLTKALGLIADGSSTDYDSLAINIGKTLRKDYKLTEKHVFPFFKPTLRDYHSDGSQILTALQQRKFIRVTKRGVTRRATIDLDTGRGSGPWRDTISREVSILNPDMKALQVANRKVLISRRIGQTSPRDKLYARVGEKTYFDARGNNTGVPIITRRANGNYDKLLIDKDFANMLNHTMSVDYEVDKEFASFMDDVVRFRDPRGNVKKYDDLNDFRKLILTRGDQGYSLMQTVKYYRDTGKTFNVQARIDGRGRVYYDGWLTPTGGEVVRPFLNTAKAEFINEGTVRELMLQTGAMIGPGTEALTQAGRMEIFLRNRQHILELGRLQTNPTQRDRRIREFLEHPLIREMDAEEVAKISRLALEYARIHDWVGGDFTNVKRLRQYKTKLMIENDASASGAQIIGLSTKDRDIAINSNVVPTTQKNRLYDLVAMDTVSDPEFLKIKALVDANISWEDLQKAAKAQNMVSFYGAGASTQAANIEAKFASVLEKKGYVVITREELRGITGIINKKIKDAEALGADQVALGLKQLKRELNEVVEGEAPVGNELIQHARDSHPDVEAFVDKLTNVRAGLVGPSDFKAVSEIMSRKLAERAPVTQKFVQFWKEAAKSYVDETQKVDVPWVTFDGKTLYQRYRPKIQTSIEFFDKEAGRMVRNIYEDRAEDATLLGKASLMRAGIGMGVNGNHMNDASIVRLFHLWGRKNSVETATIHDAFFTNIANADKVKFALREIYADALEGDTIENTLKALRSEGLSNETYKKLRQRAIDDGLINPPNQLTREDIMAPIKPGFDFYGIGP